MQKTQIENLRKVKAARDPARVTAALEAVRQAARGTDNLCPPIIEAAKAYCTEQEICDVLREVMGTYTDPAEFLARARGGAARARGGSARDATRHVAPVPDCVRLRVTTHLAALSHLRCRP